MATVRTTKERKEPRERDPKPKRPKVDRGVEFEQLLRPMYVRSVDLWCRAEMEEQPSKEVKGNIVDNLVASFTSSVETLVDASTDSYLATVTDDEDDDDDDDAADDDDDDDVDDDDDDEEEVDDD